MHPEVITSLYEEAERRVEWLEKGLKEIVNANVSTLYIKQKAQSILDGEPTTADEYNKDTMQEDEILMYEEEHKHRPLPAQFGGDTGIDADKGIKEEETKTYFSECCGAPFSEPGYPDTDLCSQCHEHTGAYLD
jgi:hypothetical protein